MASLEQNKISGITSINGSLSTSIKQNGSQGLSWAYGSSSMPFLIPNADSSAGDYHALRRITTAASPGYYINKGASGVDDAFRIFNTRTTIAEGSYGRSFSVKLNVSSDHINYWRAQPICIVCEGERLENIVYNNRITYEGITARSGAYITFGFKAWFSQAATVDITFLAIRGQDELYLKDSYYSPSYTNYYISEYIAALSSGKIQGVFTLNTKITGAVAYRFANTYEGLKNQPFNYEDLTDDDTFTANAQSGYKWFQYYITTPSRMASQTYGCRTIALQSGGIGYTTTDCAPDVSVISATNATGSYTIKVRNPGPEQARIAMYLYTPGVSGQSSYTGLLPSNSTFTYDASSYSYASNITADSYVAVIFTSTTSTSYTNQYSFRVGDIVTPVEVNH